MLTKLRIVLGAALCLALVGGAAMAEGGHHRKQGMMKKFDANNDGKLDAAEKAKAVEARKAMHAQAKAKRLALFDANKNGKLDDGEKKTMHAQKTAERFKKLDANSDGKITPDEFAAKRGGRHK